MSLLVDEIVLLIVKNIIKLFQNLIIIICKRYKLIKKIKIENKGKKET